MSTPQSAVTSAAAILLDGISAAVADRPNLTPERTKTRIAELWAVIDAFHPAGPLQIMLVGQAVMFNELLADGARDVLGGMTDALKLRAQSNLNGMNRSLHQNLSLFLRLRDTAEAASEAAEPRQSATAARETAVSATPTEPHAEPAVAPDDGCDVASTPAADIPTTMPDAGGAARSTSAAEDTGSWLDAPYTTWIIETPADVHARELAEQAALAAAGTPPRLAEMHQFDEAMTDPRPGRRQRTSAQPLVEAALAAPRHVEAPDLVGTS